MASVISSRGRVRLEQPAALGDAVGHVDELSGEEIVEVAEELFFRICVCSAATPLTEWLPTMARWAMRTRFSRPPR